VFYFIAETLMTVLAMGGGSFLLGGTNEAKVLKQ
jgi:hypothetical protein